jgi:hypothetical protein
MARICSVYRRGEKYNVSVGKHEWMKQFVRTRCDWMIILKSILHIEIGRKDVNCGLDSNSAG